ncbi:zinc ribbon domain-containing protein [Photobacterium toruni]|uniref:zinc ribbon domain-containing protein n=1 Tax=Photobacterium toruni TaxID=1935446 RepID=UPI00211049CB|nr:zinc ribbon domain-containing protein [Photobacterium toruni]
MKTTEFSALDNDNDNHEMSFSLHAEKRSGHNARPANTPDFSQPASRSDAVDNRIVTDTMTKPRSKRLTDCPACDGIVSRRAHFCPHCGEPDPSRHMQRTQWVSRIIWTIIIVAAAWYAYTSLLPLIVDRLKG